MTEERRKEIIRKLCVREERFYRYVFAHPPELKLLRDWRHEHHLDDLDFQTFPKLKYFDHRMAQLQLQGAQSGELWQYVHAEELNKEETNNEWKNECNKVS